MTVFLVTLLVLANLWTCLLVFTCVGFTLVRVTRNFFAHTWLWKGETGSIVPKPLYSSCPRERWGIPLVLSLVNLPPPPPRQGIPLVFSTRISRRTVKVLEALPALPYFSPPPPPFCFIVRSNPYLLIIGHQVNITGTMHFWGLTIDTVSTICLVLAVGLSVDYASHVGHTFMIIPGLRTGECSCLSVSIWVCFFYLKSVSTYSILSHLVPSWCVIVSFGVLPNYAPFTPAKRVFKLGIRNRELINWI